MRKVPERKGDSNQHTATQTDGQVWVMSLGAPAVDRRANKGEQGGKSVYNKVQS